MEETNEVTSYSDPDKPEDYSTDMVIRPVNEHPLSTVFRYLYEIIKTVVGILIIALLIRVFVVQPFVVDGSSMEPSFHNHEYLLVEKAGLYFKPVNRGDVIVFKYPLNTQLNYVKRVIGVPGDRVVVANGKVTIYNNQNPNGLVLTENYLPNGQITKVNNEATERTWIVADKEYFVMGDNRDHSDDSRSWGFVPKGNIEGKVWLTVYPFSNFGPVEHVTYTQ